MWSTRTAEAAVRYPARRDTAAAASAVATGAAGLLANVLLVLYFVLAPPWRTSSGTWAWLGTANDVVIVAQFAAFLPVPPALRDRLPDTRGVRASTVAALAAMLAVIVLQLLLVAGRMSFETQVAYVTAAFLVVFLWVLAVCRTAYRTAALPRRIVRAGLLIASPFPLAAVVGAIALLAPEGTPARYIGFGLAAALGAASWLALPLWPLLLAARVFGVPPTDRRVFGEGER